MNIDFILGRVIKFVVMVSAAFGPLSMDGKMAFPEGSLKMRDGRY